MKKSRPKYNRTNPPMAKTRVTDSIEEPKHSVYSASGSKIWTTCPGSVALSKTCPELPTSKYAEEGTRAHAYCEKILKGEIFNVPRKDDEMHTCAQGFAEYVRSFMKSPKAVLGCETKVSLKHIEPTMSGTCDAWVYDTPILDVFDYKHGAGLVVPAEDNTQLQYYALGLALDLFKKGFGAVKTIRTHIYQPRAQREDGAPPYSVATYTHADIDRWQKFFEDAVARTELDSDVFVAGDHCRYCRGKIKCKEIKSARALATEADFSDTSLVLPAPSEMNPDQIGEILKRAKLVETWIGAVEAHAFELLLRGETVSGWKLVEKRSIRKWSDPEKAEDDAYRLLGLDAFDLSFKSPAQIEKTIGSVAGAEWVNERAAKVSSGLTLVPESDKRPATKNLKLTAENDFSDIEIP